MRTSEDRTEAQTEKLILDRKNKAERRGERSQDGAAIGAAMVRTGEAQAAAIQDGFSAMGNSAWGYSSPLFYSVEIKVLVVLHTQALARAHTHSSSV